MPLGLPNLPERVMYCTEPPLGQYDSDSSDTPTRGVEGVADGPRPQLAATGALSPCRPQPPPPSRTAEAALEVTAPSLDFQAQTAAQVAEHELGAVARPRTRKRRAAEHELGAVVRPRTRKCDASDTPRGQRQARPQTLQASPARD